MVVKIAHLLEQKLSNRQPIPLSSWERETGRGVNNYVFGEYKLTIGTTMTGDPVEVIIEEDCSSIATRVWDCAVATSKCLEYQLERNTSSSSSSSSFTTPELLVETLQLNYDPSSSSSSRPIQVLELGSGMGLLSICLAKMGAAVMSTEYGSAVNRLQKNCERNEVALECCNENNNLLSTTTTTTTLKSGYVYCRELDWYKTTETLHTLFPLQNDTAIFDLIAVTDCSLSKKDSMGVLDMIQKYGTIGHTKVLVGLCREREGTPYFIDQANELFTKVSVVPTSQYHPDYQTNRQTILLIQL